MSSVGDLLDARSAKPRTFHRNQELRGAQAGSLEGTGYLYNTGQLHESPYSGPTQSRQRRGVDWRFGLKLRALRLERQWTQLQMAELLGINRSYLSEVERGHKSVSLGMLEVIALGLKMSISELLREI